MVYSSNILLVHQPVTTQSKKQIAEKRTFIHLTKEMGSQVSNNRIRDVKRVSVVLVKGSVYFEPPRQVRISQEHAPERDQISIPSGDRAIPILPAVAAGNDERSPESVPYRAKAVGGFELFTEFHHPRLHHVAVENPELVQRVRHVHAQSFRV
uniref:Uncharacterized protein n=1 Tax=Zea mays TaxID=4577 RepID=C0PK24_MAIZE|nr:unknown [Zea mays]ACN36613.1 unknown [Zea mays]